MMLDRTLMPCQKHPWLVVQQDWAKPVVLPWLF